MMEIIPKSKLPKDHKLSMDLLEKADYFAAVRLHGILYYIPVGLRERKLMGLRICKGQPVFNVRGYKHSSAWDDFLRNMVAVVYLQTRDTVGSEIQQNLMQEIHHGFDRILFKGIERKIENLLPKPSDTLRIPNEPA